MIKIIKNAIKCNHCGDILVSTGRHDFVECSCKCCFADGGTEYLRRGYRDSRDDYTELSEVVEEEDAAPPEG